MMDLTKGQQAGLEMVRRLAAAKGHQVGVLAGFAGTGKTYLLKVIAEELGVPMVLSPTGKAAARVTELTGLGASTIHRWQYKPITNDKTGKTSWARLPPDLLDRGECGVLVVDEASMVNRRVWADVQDNAQLLGLKVLCVGDAFQLPPIEDDGKEGFSLLDPSAGIASEYVLMTEVVRQAQESPIIRASMAVREGDVMGALAMLPSVPPDKFIDKAAVIQAQGGMVLCHRNTTRHWANATIRKARGFPTDDIRDGEPVLVLKNNYALMVFNGETYEFAGWEELSHGRHTIYDRWQKTREESRFGRLRLRDAGRNGEIQSIVAQEELLGRLRVGFQAIEATADITFPKEPVLHANLGYCLTCHKFQGSEADEVLIAWEPSLRFWGRDRETSLRWAYTAFTRSRTTCYVSLGASAPEDR